jgi:hypothetical protein
VTAPAIKSGKMLSWGYAKVESPTGTAYDHDLIGFYGYSKVEDMEPQDEPNDAMKAAIKALGFASPADYAAKRDPLRDITRSQILRRAAGTTTTAATAPKAGEYVVVSFLKTEPGKAAAYISAWKDYSLPIQEQRVATGKAKSYSLWTVAGAGEGDEYNIVSLTRYATWADVNGGNPTDADTAAEHAHPGKDWRQMQRDMQSLRHEVHSELTQIKFRTQ